jgi:Uma2 family endonuclease
MGSMSEAIGTYSEAEYLALEQRSEVRHEYVGGRLYQMSGGTERHELAVAALVRRLYPGARAAGCRTFANRQLRVPSGDHFYPDVMVACGKAANQLYEERPNLIVEVLSPTTAAEDRKGKLRAYATCETLDRYLIVDPVFRRFECYSQGTWQSFGPGDVVETGYGPIPIEEFYDDLDAEATT